MDDRLQHIQARLPGDVRLTSQRHPLAGQMVRAEQAHRWNGEIWLVVKLSDGYPSRVRVSETDLCGDGRLEQVGLITLSAEGVRALRDFIARLKVRIEAVDAP